MQLKDKSVVVTGAGNGIGKAIAIALAAEGAKVVVNDYNVSFDGDQLQANFAQKVVDEIIAKGGQAVANTDSVAEYESAERMIETAVAQFGKIDAVVNNAGIVLDRMFHKMSPEEFDRVVKVHLYGTFNISRAAASHFRKNNGGAMVHMTSNAAVIGNRGQANYCAAKMGIVGMSKAIALDMGMFNVRSNCIAPIAWSRMTESIPSKTPEQEKFVQKIKQMTPESIAPLAAYLISDHSANVSGQIFAVRKNEIFLMGQSRPLKSVHNSEGWDIEKINELAMPSLSQMFMPLDTSSEVFNTDPI